MIRRIALVLIVAVTGCGATAEGDLDAAEVDAAEEDTPDARPRADARVFPDAPPEPDGSLSADARPQADAAPGGDARPPDGGGSPDAGPTGEACLGPPAATPVTTSTVLVSQTFSGAVDDYAFESNQCSDEPDSAERIYSFELDVATQWYAETRCGSSSSWDCELVLTRDGCADADVVACETTAGDEEMTGTLQPGRYGLFIEGDNPEDPAVFDLMVNFHHTAGQAQCAATTLDVMRDENCRDPNLEDPQYRIIFDGATSPEDVDDFFVEGVDECTNDDDGVGGAPDKVYRLVLPAAREVRIDLETDWDALLYVTRSPCGAASAVVACSDDLTGSTETIEENLGAGTWYIVVDGFGEETFGANSWGAFTMEVKVYDDACDE